ncbi:MAG TPA: AAA family ATPase [Verrucomicrobiae bacterium]|jgi:BioD-like phosphotransacetylase family protein
MRTNVSTPRVFIAATRQNDGKTTASLGLLNRLREFYPRVGYIKPVGQRYVEVAEHKIDEDTVLMDSVYGLNCPLKDMSPIAIEPDFTRRYLQESRYDELLEKLEDAFDRVAWEKDFVLCEGSGHAGVGAVFDLSNARVAKILDSKVIIVTRGGIGKPIDEVTINHALFEKEGVEVIGVILNKVTPEKLDYVADFARRGLKRKGLDLLGVLPLLPMLSKPTVAAIREELNAEVLAGQPQLQNIVEDIVVGAMAAQNAARHFKPGVLIITPGDREDIIMAAATSSHAQSERQISGLVLTGDVKPCGSVMRLLAEVEFPVLMVKDDSYVVASKVHDMTVKTHAEDKEKINLIRDLIARHVDVKKILKAL